MNESGLALAVPVRRFSGRAVAWTQGRLDLARRGVGHLLRAVHPAMIAPLECEQRALSPRGPIRAQQPRSELMSRMELGVMSSPKPECENPFEVIASYGVRATQFAVWAPALLTPKNAALASIYAKEVGVKIAAVWAGCSGPAVWNFTEGPLTLGLVPAPV